MKKILVLSANPIDTNQLRLDEEVREIQAAWERSRYRAEFQLITRWAVRVDDLRRALLDNNPDLVHFSGHGSGTEGLVLVDSSGFAQLVSTEALSKLFQSFKDKTECVLLNACYSEVQADAIYEHINCVIGMKNPIQDNAAIDFSKGFYDAIFAGRSYSDSFQLGRNNIDLNNIPESLIPTLKIKQDILPSFEKESRCRKCK